jgi:large subunit ribosomal protein L10
MQGQQAGLQGLQGAGSLYGQGMQGAAKVVAEFSKTNDKLVIRGGAYGGKALDVDGVKQLASIPSKEVLLAQLLGLMQSPISRTARVLAAIAEKKGAGAEATLAEPVEAVAA